MTQVIKIPSGTKWLSDCIDDLPANCMFNKGSVGCGGTTIALKNSHNYIICVPFVALIQNKIDQTPNVFGIFKGFKVKELKAYLADESIPIKKIMVTYDSLPTIIKYINPQEYHLLVDELHLLFTSMSFRYIACRNVLDNYTKFKQYCFMTATMLEEEFVMSELAHLPIVIAEWEDVKTITIRAVPCDAPLVHTVIFLVKQYLSGEKSGNCYLFVNSVEFIKDLVGYCGLTDENCRAIWSINNPTKTGLTRGTTTEDPKKINIMTSTCFEGVDILDVHGHTYVISDGAKAHTLVDISTSMQQIAGRIRNTLHLGTITHIYNTTKYAVKATYEEYKKATEEEVIKAKRMVNDFPNLTDDYQGFFKAKMKKDITGENYLMMRDDNIVFDENLVKIDLYNFKVTKSLYTVNVKLFDEYQKNGFNKEVISLEVDKVVKVNPKPNFKDTVIELQKGDSDFALQAFKKYPFLHEAIEKIGFTGIEELKYSTTNIRSKLITLSKANNFHKIGKELELIIKEGYFYEPKPLKQLLWAIHNKYNPGAKVTAKDIDTYYITKYDSKRKKDKKDNTEKVVKGFTIIKKRLI